MKGGKVERREIVEMKRDVEKKDAKKKGVERKKKYRSGLIGCLLLFFSGSFVTRPRPVIHKNAVS